MRPGVRTLPIRLLPLPGESFDSWLYAYASRLDTPLQDIGAAAALPQGFLRQPPRFIALGKNLDHTDGLAHATGLERDSVEQMWAPLARYTGTVRSRLRRSGLLRIVVPLAWSRYCPACLARDGNRWQVAWRLGWHTTCGVHGCFLLDGCTGCRRHQRQEPFVQTAVDPRLRCTARRPSLAGGQDCGHDLTTGRVGAGADVLRRTTAFQDAVTSAYAPGTPPSAQNDALHVLADVLLIAGQLDGPTPVDPQRSAAVADVAGLLARAWDVHRGNTSEDLDRLFARDPHQPGVLARGWSTASPSLAARVLSAQDARLRITDRLRWRTTTEPRQPTDAGLRVARERARLVPDALWADWALRLTPQTGVDPTSFRVAGAAALLIPGTPRPLEKLLSGTSHDGRSRKVIHVLGSIPPKDSKAILGALTQLADALDLNGGPIDYHRRRDLASSVDLLDDLDWERICAAAGTPKGGIRKLNNARLRIFETLTGSPLQSAPAAIRPDDERTTAYHAFAFRLPAQAAELLDNRARHILARNGITEPLTWSPPRDWVQIDRLPGPEPDDIDVDHLERLLRSGRSTKSATKSLNVSLEHLRLAVRCHPLANEPPGAMADGRSWNRRPFPPELTPHRLRSLVVDEGRTVRSIATEHGVDRKTIMAALARENIPHGPPGRRPIGIGADWLRAEYIEHRRTLPDIARQLGTTPPSVARLAAKHGIPLRPRGAASHARNLAAPDNALPHPLAAAIAGEAGPERVRRYQVLARSPSIRQAALAMGWNEPTIYTQLKALEHCCGGALLSRYHRSPETRKLTPLGQALLDQADHHLGLPTPAKGRSA